MTISTKIARGASMMALVIMAFSTVSIASATPSPNDTVVLAGSTAAITDANSQLWTITTSKQVAVNGKALSTTSGVTEIAYVNGVVWEKNNAGWYALGMAPAVLSGPIKTSPLPTVSPDKTVVMAGATTAIIDANLNSWTITSGGQIAVNGATISFTGAVTEIAYVKGVLWQLGNGQWYSLAMVAGVATTTAGPIATSPLVTLTPSTNDTVVLAGATTAIIDANLNSWTITSGGQVAVNGTAITVTGNVTEIAYVNGVLWQLGNGQWYSVVTIAGATTTFSAGTTTSPLPPSPITTGAVPYGPSYYVISGGSYVWAGSAGYDAVWDQMKTLMGRSPSIAGNSLAYCNGGAPVYANTPANWECSASAIIPLLTSDTRTNAASGTIPMIAWPFGDSSGDGVNYFSAISSGADDCAIENVLSQFNAAGYHKMILRPAWEMNGNWYGWGLTSSNYPAFIAAWDHFYTTVHNYAAGTSSVSCGAGTASNASPVMSIDIAYGPATGGVSNASNLPVTAWTPPAAYIDSYSIDDYGNGGAPGAVDSTGTKYLISTAVALAKANGKSISGSEIGGLATTWTQAYVNYLATVGVPIAFWGFWDSNVVQDIPAGVGSWSMPGDADCTTGTSASGAGGSSACGVNSSGAPTNPSVAYWWTKGFGANGLISNH